MSSEQSKSWHDQILQLEQILDKEEFITVPHHLTFNDFKEWVVNSLAEKED